MFIFPSIHPRQAGSWDPRWVIKVISWLERDGDDGISGSFSLKSQSCSSRWKGGGGAGEETTRNKTCLTQSQPHLHNRSRAPA